jgi:hypothetical protein
MFAWYETEKISIARLFANLQQRLANNTNSFQLTYQLARLHSMAYSTNLITISVRTNDQSPQFDYPGSDSGVPRTVSLPPTPQARQTALDHLTNAIRLYERTIVLLRKSTNTDEQRWLILPTQLGLAWCLDQAGRRKDALEAYRKTLNVAWKTEITGDFTIQEWIKGVWNDVSSGRNPIRSSRRGFIGPGVCYSQEVIRYMLNLLDPVKDAKEIAALKDRQTTLNGMGRAITPILVPLTPATALADLVDPEARVTFDLDGSGLPREWGWITPKAAWLVFDSDGSGQITSALQMFGNVTFWIFWHDGYDALGSLDADGDSVLRGAELHGLALWHDRNGNGVSEAGEVRAVEQFGITAIACTPELHQSGISWLPRGVTFSDGSSRPSYDWIAPSRIRQP